MDTENNTLTIEGSPRKLKNQLYIVQRSIDGINWDNLGEFKSGESIPLNHKSDIQYQYKCKIKSPEQKTKPLNFGKKFKINKNSKITPKKKKRKNGKNK